MGHSEMLLAVAGLTPEEIEARTADLADGDWAGFPPAERAAFRLANRLTAEPWSVTDVDVSALKAAFGDVRALDLIWQISWCNYMTRVADAFQLPLESTNVFEPQEKPAKPAKKKHGHKKQGQKRKQ
jgi:alkylhydroperoxidase family enzyme